MTCEHKEVKSLESSTLNWCLLCGTVIHYVKTGGTFKPTEIGVFCDFNGQTSSTYYYSCKNIRENKHLHSWFKLTMNYKWCSICGALEIIKMVDQPFDIKAPVERKGILLPKRRQIRLDILKVCDLVDKL